MNKSAELRGLAMDDYSAASAAFAYIVGWYAIQTSALSFSHKHRLSAELATAWLRELKIETNETLDYLQRSVAEYRDALQTGRGVSPEEKLAFRLTEIIETDDPAILGGAVFAAKGGVAAMREFLTGVQQHYSLS